jgi:hypothetical protein
MRKWAVPGLALGLLLGLAGTSSANDLLATELFSGTVVAFQPQGQYANMTLRVTGPHEFHASAAFPGGSPAVDLTKYGAVYDGTYNYHLTGTTGETILSSGRSEGRPSRAVSPYQLNTVSKGGSFRVQGGAIVSRTLTEPKRTR